VIKTIRELWIYKEKIKDMWRYAIKEEGLIAYYSDLPEIIETVKKNYMGDNLGNRIKIYCHSPFSEIEITESIKIVRYFPLDEEEKQKLYEELLKELRK